MPKAVAITILFVLGSAAVQGAQSAEQAIREVEEQWLQNESNPAVLDSILADDFVHVLPAGFITKQEQLQFVRNHPRPAGETRRFEELRVRVYGDTAIATGIVDAREDQSRQPRQTMFTDVFVRREDKWQAVNSQELPWATAASGK